MSLHRTPEFHHLLQAVAEEHVLHFNGLCGAHPEGWGWVGMAHMPVATESDLDALRHARLISFTAPADPCGNKVLLTLDGSDRLASWNDRFPANPYSTGGAA